MRFTKRILERGSVTLPSDVREALRIDDGDFVEFEIVSVMKKSEIGRRGAAASGGPTPPRRTPVPGHD